MERKVPAPSNKTTAPSHVAPAGWPIVDDGLYMTFVDRILIVRLTERLTPSAFDRYRAEWLRAIDARPREAHVGAMYDIPSWPGFSALQRKQWGEMLKSREAVLARTTRALAVVTPSQLTRGATSAVLWLAPPPYPHLQAETLREGFEFIALHMAGLDPVACEASYMGARG